MQCHAYQLHAHLYILYMHDFVYNFFELWFATVTILQTIAVNNTNDVVEQLRLIREFCESDCINTILPPCAAINQDIADGLNIVMQSKFQL